MPTSESQVCRARERHAIVSALASDSHTWNLVFLELLLREHGWTVTNLGACTPDELLIERCVDLDPTLIVLSSVNGHGYQEGMRVISHLRATAECAETSIVIGGKLGIDGPDPELSAGLVRAGFDLVVEEEAETQSFMSMIASTSVKEAS